MEDKQQFGGLLSRGFDIRSNIWDPINPVNRKIKHFI